MPISKQLYQSFLGPDFPVKFEEYEQMRTKKKEEESQLLEALGYAKVGDKYVKKPSPYEATQEAANLQKTLGQITEQEATTPYAGPKAAASLESTQIGAEAEKEKLSTAQREARLSSEDLLGDLESLSSTVKWGKGAKSNKMWWIDNAGKVITREKVAASLAKKYKLDPFRAQKLIYSYFGGTKPPTELSVFEGLTEELTEGQEQPKKKLSSLPTPISIGKTFWKILSGKER